MDELKELTKAEEQIMQELWEMGGEFVKDIIAQLPNPKPAYNTVSTIIRILETKGFVEHESFGKSHRYLPKISKGEYKKLITGKLLYNYFDNAAKRMLYLRCVTLHAFSHKSILKKRIIMLFKDKSKRRSKLLYFSLAPVITLAVLSTLIFNTSKARGLVHQVETQVEGALVKDRFEVRSQEDRMPTVFSEGVVDNGEKEVSNTTAKTDQKRDTTRNKGNEDIRTMVFSNPEIMAEPVGGIMNFRKWVGENYRYPQGAIDAGVKGKISISFIVEKDGSLSSFKIVEDIGYGTGEALIDVLRKSAKWKPGMQNGRNIRVQYTLPMHIDLTA